MVSVIRAAHHNTLETVLVMYALHVLQIVTFVLAKVYAPHVLPPSFWTMDHVHLVQVIAAIVH